MIYAGMIALAENIYDDCLIRGIRRPQIQIVRCGGGGIAGVKLEIK
jgi:hypothetical protein